MVQCVCAKKGTRRLITAVFPPPPECVNVNSRGTLFFLLKMDFVSLSISHSSSPCYRPGLEESWTGLVQVDANGGFVLPQPETETNNRSAAACRRPVWKSSLLPNLLTGGLESGGMEYPLSILCGSRTRRVASLESSPPSYKGATNPCSPPSPGR